MAVFYFLSVFLAFVYIFIITHLFTAWNEVEEWQTDDNFQPKTSVSIIIPFRNEEQHLEACVQSVLQNQFPKSLYEIIAVNDHSEDNGVARIKQVHSPNIKNFNLKEYHKEGKKEAIKLGVSKATGKLIITLDADCTVPREWLMSIVSYHEYTGKSMIAGLVSMDGSKNTLEYFQIMDTCGTMGLHVAGIHNGTHYLANGANFAFEKRLFEETNPYDANSEYASGDDVFFINSIAEKDPSVIGVLKSKDAVASTKAEKDWSSLINQRIRWAGKTAGFAKGIYKWMTGLIWLFSWSIIVNFFLIPFTAGFSLFVLLMQLLIKGIMDYLYLHNMCKYFNKTKSLKRFFPASAIQILYVAVAGIYALKGGDYKWKGRILR